ncbi:2Fe-2S iron-sulfur cluster binding domain-containing protein [Rhodobacterales bacterium HKCCE2091]|nr:2Fe-2S iron-sulfur cluster binding domain-containing protein [Rhodobacterales bacterium HKCCE2091]
MIRITVEDRNGAVSDHEIKGEGPLMFALRDEAGGYVEGICGGCATCGSCHVFIAEEWRDRLPEIGDYEAAMLDMLESYDAAASRLSCQIEAGPELDGLKLKIAPEE